MKLLMPALFLFVLVACQQKNGGVGFCGLSAVGDFVVIPAGELTPTFDAQYPEEGQPATLVVREFKLQAHEVTNDQFSQFVAASNYVTDAEKNLDVPSGGSALFSLPTDTAQGRWSLVKGATWKQPNGVGSDLTGLGQHPVVHVSHNDAMAYAQWVGARLPTETEWEYAAHLGLADPSDSSSGAYNERGEPIANTWQGIFPVVDAGKDGYRSTAPIGCYSASKIGLHDMIGNVWEWTSTPYTKAPLNTNGLAPQITNFTIKGGSYLCANNFCKRYRPAARQPQEQNFSTNHIGFRVAKD